MIKIKVGVLNFQSSNALPLFHTLRAIGHQATLIDSPISIRHQDKLIIPGVGHIKAFTRELDAGGYRESILEHILSEKFVLGICLGMHALTSGSQEDITAQTFSIFSSKVDFMASNLASQVRIPHVGWNSVRYKAGQELFDSIPQQSDFYFSHSFGISSLSNETIGTTKHGEIFSSAINHENVFGVQFHPEKSQKFGERLLSNFCRL